MTDDAVQRWYYDTEIEHHKMHEDGAFVLHSDYAALRKRCEKAEALCESLAQQIEDMRDEARERTERDDT
jgi:hypothetical protein